MRSGLESHREDAHELRDLVLGSSTGPHVVGDESVGRHATVHHVDQRFVVHRDGDPQLEEQRCRGLSLVRELVQLRSVRSRRVADEAVLLELLGPRSSSATWAAFPSVSGWVLVPADHSGPRRFRWRETGVATPPAS